MDNKLIPKLQTYVGKSSFRDTATNPTNVPSANIHTFTNAAASNTLPSGTEAEYVKHWALQERHRTCRRRHFRERGNAGSGPQSFDKLSKRFLDWQRMRHCLGPPDAGHSHNFQPSMYPPRRPAQFQLLQREVATQN